MITLPCAADPQKHLQLILMATSHGVPNSLWVIKNELLTFHLKGPRKKMGTEARYVYTTSRD